MYKSKPTSRFLLYPIILLLLLTTVSSQTEEPDDSEDIQELIALDEQETQTEHSNPSDSVKKSEAETVSKAQRIVLELNDENFKRAIESNEYVLLLGYAPWCGRSAELMPRFAEAANVLKGLGSLILLAKIDAERYSKAGSSLGIKGFPTMLLFVNGSSQRYTGGFSADEIVLWARKKTGAPIIRINSIPEANDFKKQHAIYAVGFFEDYKGRDYEEFVKAATADNEIQFVETNSAQIAMLLNPVSKTTNVFFGLVKSEPEHYTSLDGSLSVDRILNFLETNKFPLVTVMTELNSAKVYASTNKLQVYVFAEASDLKKLLEPLQDTARRFKSKMMIVAVDIEEENLAKPFLTLFGLEDSEQTVVTAFDYNSNSKYLLESDPTPRKIEEFCLGLLKGTLSTYYKSQSIPDNKNANILTIVGKTFDDLVLNSPPNVLLEVHTPWCITCEATSKQIEKLAKHFKGLENLVFARLDASANEHPKLQVDDYPTLLFYPSNDKSNPIKLSTKSNLKELAALINKNLKTLAKDEL